MTCGLLWPQRGLRGQLEVFYWIVSTLVAVYILELVELFFTVLLREDVEGGLVDLGRNYGFHTVVNL